MPSTRVFIPSKPSSPKHPLTDLFGLGLGRIEFMAPAFRGRLAFVLQAAFACARLLAAGPVGTGAKPTEGQTGGEEVLEMLVAALVPIE